MNLTAPNLRACLLPGTLCLVSLAAGVVCGLKLRGASADAVRLSERRGEVQALSPAEKDRLNHNNARFVKLENGQQQGLRELQAELAAAPDADELRGVMHRYHAWLKTLTPFQRDELLDLADEPVRRLQRVAEMMPLSQEDLRVVHGWSQERLKERGVPDSTFKSPGQSAMILHGMLFTQNRGFGRPFPPGGPGKTPSRPKPLTAEEFELLTSQLSKGPQTVLKRERTVAEKGQRVGNWLFGNWFFGRFRPEDSRAAGPSNEELVRFFTDELSDQDREKLLALPLPDLKRDLWLKYQTQRKGNAPSGFPGGKPRGAQPDEPRKASPESAGSLKPSGKQDKAAK